MKMSGFKMEQIKQNINITGSRVLFILSLLLKDSLTKNEIIKLISSNPELNDVCPDTIRLDINTLRDAGFVIENSPVDYKYRLLWAPIKIKLQKSEISILNKIKKAAISLWDWKSILNLYKAFLKIADYIEDDELRNRLLDFRNFKLVDLKLLAELNYHCVEKNEIVIEYNSPKGEIIQIHLKCLEINFNHSTQKLHLYCKFPGYKDMSYLRIDKIIRIINVLKDKTIEEPAEDFRFYKLKKSAFNQFNLEENEEIVSENDDFITIKVKLKNKFHLMQRLALLGEDAICDEPDIKAEFLSNLLKTKEVYK